MAQCIYFLYDPREGPGAEPRYVGKTSKTIARRLTEHLHLAKTGDHTYRSHWIASLLTLGVRPAIACIEDEVPDELIDEREVHWISALRDNGARLTNLTDGGDGTPGRVMSEDERQRVIQMQTEMWADPDRRAERLEAIRSSDRWTREAKEAQGLQMKEFWSDPNFRRRTQKGMRRAWADPEYRSVMLDLAAKRWADPEFKMAWGDAYRAASERQRESLRRKWQDPSYRATKAAQASRQMTEHWSDPANKSQMSEAQKLVWTDPEYRRSRESLNKTQAATMRDKWKDPKFRENQSIKQSAAMKRRMADPSEKAAQAQRLVKAREAWVNLPPCPNCGRQISSPAARANHIRKCSSDGICTACHKRPRMDPRTLCRECYNERNRKTRR